MIKTNKLAIILAAIAALETTAAFGGDTPALKPLLSGFNPDPSICRVGEDYYLVTSSFEIFPGVPVYHSKDLRHWEVIGHAWSHPEFSSYARTHGRNDDDGIWAPTIRYNDGTFYVCVTWRGREEQANYIVTAKDPAGPWSRPVKVQANTGIDGSLFFDDDGRVYYHSNCRPPKIEWGRQCAIWAQEVDVETGELKGERHILSCGSGHQPVLAEGPHIYKISGKYYLLMAQGGTGYRHAASLHVADGVFGPYKECKENPVITASDWGTRSPIQAFGHADIVDTPDGKWYGVFLGKRYLGEGKELNTLCPLGRETFMCPVVWEGETAKFLRDEAIEGEWCDPLNTWYSLMTHPEWHARLRKVKSHNETFRAELKPGEAIVLYRSDEGYYARTNTTDRTIAASVTLDGTSVFFEMDDAKEGPLPVNPLCDQKKINRFNGLMVGTFTLPRKFSWPEGESLKTGEWTADPSARVFGDTLYVYTSHDNDSAEKTFDMTDWRVYSTTNMIDWIDHGELFSLKDIPWASSHAWAPDAAQRGGKYYLYYPVERKKIGVAVSSVPTGGFSDSGKPLVDGVGKEPIDPCVFCEAGEAYMWFGCRELFMARLAKNMTHIEGEITKVDVPDYAEAPFVFKRGETYYLMYSNGWAKDSTLVYATADSPEGPWNYRGEVMPNQDCSTSHGSVVKFNDKWYLFYHDRSLSGNNYRRSAKWRETTFGRNGEIQVM